MDKFESIVKKTVVTIQAALIFFAIETTNQLQQATFADSIKKQLKQESPAAPP